MDMETAVRSAPIASDTSPVVRVSHLSKLFRRNDGSEVVAVADVSFEVGPAESVVLLGPSGCGKTTLMRCIAGLEDPDTGSIEVNGKTVFSSRRGINVRAELRNLAMVFQSYALWPHLTVEANIAFPLIALPRSRRPSKAEIAERVHDIMRKVGIAGLEKQYPNAISGGQQQRVALSRALIAGTNLVLFDEPLSNIDAQVREQLREELLAMQREFKFASLFVTHDRQEAMVLADRIAVLQSGAVRQLDAPGVMYHHPVDRFVGRFIGPANQVAVTRPPERSGDVWVTETDLGPIRGHPGEIAAADLIAMWRPEATVLSQNEPSLENRWRCTVLRSMFYGSHAECIVSVEGKMFRVLVDGASAPSENASFWLGVSARDVTFLADR